MRETKKNCNKLYKLKFFALNMNKLKQLPTTSVLVSDTENKDIGQPFANATIKLRCVQKNFVSTNVTKLKFRG
jgi:hypothetical protein